MALLVYEGSNPYDYVAVRGTATGTRAAGTGLTEAAPPPLIEAWSPVSAPAPG